MFVFYVYQFAMYQKSEWEFFDQGSIDGKSEDKKVEKCHLMAELKLKMINMQKARTPITCTRILDRVPLVHKKWHVELIEDFLSLHLVFKFWKSDHYYRRYGQKRIRMSEMGIESVSFRDVMGADLCVTPPSGSQVQNSCPPNLRIWASLQKVTFSI